MDQAISEDSVDEIAPPVKAGQWDGRFALALIVAVVSTALIIEAIVMVINGRANGDMMVAVCPILGSVFLSIPAVRAWWVVIERFRKP